VNTTGLLFALKLPHIGSGGGSSALSGLASGESPSRPVAKRSFGLSCALFDRKMLIRFRGAGCSSFQRSPASPAKPSIGVKLYGALFVEASVATDFWLFAVPGFEIMLRRFDDELSRFDVEALVFGFDSLFFWARSPTGTDCSLPIATVCTKIQSN
jgi:hypothetical protein